MDRMSKVRRTILLYPHLLHTERYEESERNPKVFSEKVEGDSNPLPIGINGESPDSTNHYHSTRQLVYFPVKVDGVTVVGVYPNDCSDCIRAIGPDLVTDLEFHETSYFLIIFGEASPK